MSHAQPPRRIGTQQPEPARDPDHDPDHVDLAVARVQPTRAAPRLAMAMWLVAAFVIIAVLKPWGGAGPATETLRPDAVAAPDITPAPTEDRSATGLALPICLGTGAWRVATLETSLRRATRVWRAIEPVSSVTGFDDPSIPSVPIVADQLSGLGFCAPAFGPAMPVGPAHVQAWQVLSPTVTNQVPLRQVQPASGATPIAALYVPRFGSWTTGRIVFEYEDTGAGTVWWFAVDLRITPVAAPSASPAPSPRSS
jgi:hypothetical protein